MSSNYTIVEPGFEFVPPPEEGKELEFLEICTRTCYKSEEHVKPGSAEKLMKKVVSEYKHMSVTEHVNIILEVRVNLPERLNIVKACPLFGWRISYIGLGKAIISGNIRMWTELINNEMFQKEYYELCNQLKDTLHQKLPFFFDKGEDLNEYCDEFKVLDENPITNNDNLSPELMKKHMTLTYRLIGTRSMSHQLVRHRLCAFSQESQRYCNYGKKGFQFIIPPSIPREMAPMYTMESANTSPHPYHRFIDSAVAAYKQYLALLEDGLKPEDARELLPNCCKTEVVTTCTLDNWAHIIHHRADNPKAQWQIKGIMQGIKNHMYGILPWMDEQEKDGEA